jgi:hypothetical protein
MDGLSEIPELPEPLPQPVPPPPPPPPPVPPAPPKPEPTPTAELSPVTEQPQTEPSTVEAELHPRTDCQQETQSKLLPAEAEGPGTLAEATPKREQTRAELENNQIQEKPAPRVHAMAEEPIDLRSPELIQDIFQSLEDDCRQRGCYQLEVLDGPTIPIYGEVSYQEAAILRNTLEQFPDFAKDDLSYVNSINVVDFMPCGIRAEALEVEGHLIILSDSLAKPEYAQRNLCHEIGHAVDYAHDYQLSSHPESIFGKGNLTTGFDSDEFPSQNACKPSYDDCTRQREDFAECYRIATTDPRFDEKMRTLKTSLSKLHGENWEENLSPVNRKYLEVYRGFGLEP